jgi:hypothetical protein
MCRATEEQNYRGFDRMRAWRFKNLAELLDGNHGNHWPPFENPVSMAERTARDFDWQVNNHTARLSYMFPTQARLDAERAENERRLEEELGPFGREWMRERGML